MKKEPFGTLYDAVTKAALRAATPEEYEATRQSVIRGERGNFRVGDVERYVAGSTPAGSLNLARFTPLMLTSIIELLPIGVAVATDGTATTIIGNRRFEEILGLPAGRNLSLTAPKSERPTEFRVLVDGAEVDDADLPFQRAMRTGEPISGIIVDVVRAGGVKIPVEMSAAPLRDEYGRIVGGVGVFCRRDDRDAAIVAARLRRDLPSASGGWFQAITNALPEHVWACKEKARPGTGTTARQRTADVRAPSSPVSDGWIRSIPVISRTLSSRGRSQAPAAERSRRSFGCDGTTASTVGSTLADNPSAGRAATRSIGSAHPPTSTTSSAKPHML